VIVDTSALVAIAQHEPGSERLAEAIAGGGLVPAPVLVEFQRVVTDRGAHPAAGAQSVLEQLLVKLAVEPFTAEDAQIAAAANLEHGAGNRRGGRLNLLDLMVYAVARRTGLPILCTGADFAAAGAPLHPASRGW
jgi:ribonuclease VapC